jgi:hypothetical protein
MLAHPIASFHFRKTLYSFFLTKPQKTFRPSAASSLPFPILPNITEAPASRPGSPLPPPEADLSILRYPFASCQPLKKDFHKAKFTPQDIPGQPLYGLKKSLQRLFYYPLKNLYESRY